MSKIEVLVKNLTTIGEGPHFDEGLLYYVDIIGNSVGRYDTGSGKNVFIKVRPLRRIPLILGPAYDMRATQTEMLNDLCFILPNSNCILLLQVPGGTFVSFITPIGGSDGSEFLIGHDQTAALAKIDWDEGKVRFFLTAWLLWETSDFLVWREEDICVQTFIANSLANSSSLNLYRFWM